jgi:hypothetical protein
VHVPIVVSLLVILVAITASIVASLIATRGGKSGGGGEEPDTGSDRDLELASRPVRRTR